MIAFGYRTPPRGVGDPESDWILAAIFGGLGLFLRHLMSNRFPTLSGLWHLPLVGAVLWAACLAAVLFGVRRVMQTWPLWTFVLATATPLPYLLVTAAAGGGTVVAASVTGLIGGIAVALAGTLSPPRRRLGVAATVAVLGVAVGFAAAGLDHLPHSGLVVALLTGGVIPVSGFVFLHAGAPRPDTVRKPAWPRRSLASLIALCLGAVLVFVLNLPFGSAPVAPVRAEPNWPARLGIPAVQSFPFIARYLGSGATFVRHAVRSRPGYPEAAVDVITADNLAVLRTYGDAIWYPATVPPNYRVLDLPGAVVSARAAATDSSLATSADARDWYVVTWVWETAETYQQIFVVVNQTWTSQAPPLEPAPLSFRANVIGPALWLARQQADPAVVIDPLVTARAQQVVDQVLTAGGLRHG